MKIQPMAGASTPAPVPTAPSQAAQSAKARAVAILTGGGQQQPATQVVQNQSQVTAEELQAIQTPETRQEDSTESHDTALEASTSPEVPAPPQTEAEEQGEEKPKDPAVSRLYAQLARQEKAHRAKVATQDAALRQREAALAAREAELTQQNDRYKGYLAPDRIKADPLSALEEVGISYDDVTQRALNRVPTDPTVTRQMTAMQQTIEDLRAELNGQKKVQEDAQSAQYRAAVTQIRNETNQLVKTDENFEMIRITNSTKDVVDLIERTFKEDGVLLTVAEAANQVENYLVDEAERLAKAKKISQRLSKVAPKTASSPAQTPAAPVPPKQPQPMKTLTNATSSSRQLSGRERALLAFNGQLKS